jgi:hypothetical protein
MDLNAMETPMSKIGSFIKRRPVLTAVIGGGVLLAGAGAVNAQYGGGWGGPGGWRGHHGGPGMMRGARMERMCSMDTARWQPVMRAWVKADLGLNAAQAAEFDKLADTVHPAVEQIKAEVCGNFGPSAPKVSAPERLEKAAATARKVADAMDKAVAPAKNFYATLDDKQKARVEELMERRRGRMARAGQMGGQMGGYGHGRMGGGWGQGGYGQGQMMGPQGNMPPAPPFMQQPRQ